MSAALHWEVLALVSDDRGNLVGLRSSAGGVERCGHQHATEEEAFWCPWVPEPWPGCGLYPRQVRTEAPPVQARMPWAATAGRRAR